MLGRQLFITCLTETMPTITPIHLLGATLPQEFIYYRDNPQISKHIASLDTSSPIVHGLLGECYHEEKGLPEKKKIKLIDLFLDEPTEKQIGDIIYNTTIFRKFCW
jgi:hypothetical protein